MKKIRKKDGTFPLKPPTGRVKFVGVHLSNCRVEVRRGSREDRDVPRRGGTKSKPTVCTVNCRPWCSKLWDLRISRTDSLYQWRGLNQTKRWRRGLMRPEKANFRLSDGVHKSDRKIAFSGRIRPRRRHFRLVKATTLVQTVGSG